MFIPPKQVIYDAYITVAVVVGMFVRVQTLVNCWNPQELHLSVLFPLIVSSFSSCLCEFMQAVYIHNAKGIISHPIYKTFIPSMMCVALFWTPGLNPPPSQNFSLFQSHHHLSLGSHFSKVIWNEEARRITKYALLQMWNL